MMKDDILRRKIACNEKITVVPNYVLTDTFKPSKTKEDIDILFIGRLAEQKNIEALLEAVSNMEVKLTIIGQGHLKDILRGRNSNLAEITWIDRIANTDIPQYINRAKIFILPSLYEGHPKTLIEAMACGAAVIGADSPGIREVIRHKETGLLCGIEPQSITSAIQELIDNPSLRKQLGTAARDFAEKEYALDAIVKAEYDLYQRTVREFGKRGNKLC
jgi:glycosyltransferase involved in cell wall biosynthesis